MKYNDVFNTLKAATKLVEDRYSIADSFKEKGGVSNLFKDLYNATHEDNNKRTPYEQDLGNFDDYGVEDIYENHEVAYNEKSEVYKENNDNYENQLNDVRKIDEEILEEKKPTYTNNALLDAITHEITPFGLQQAIVLSEIISKPKCKTRRRRRF
ncbi:hypothetical protein SAMN02745163_03157 [Clostridium cavendishii DSM 21758]|uniref:Uncharacterized protein n=1 Tax=Clostridium cavendishii DSM 21758 TaxID=1121302 RepID=A0A1M6PHC8_9CLOT|nr:hypothetical protein [Clostridium cavendishii]SHK07365.1 hypothetical protein SAMN02745163_03157 [Clostridium cavendishii DSM 21758]